MNGLVVLLKLLAWYQDKDPSEAKNIVKKSVKLVKSLEELNKYLGRAIGDMELSQKEAEMLYLTIFKNDYESELISALNKFLEATKELDLIPAKDRKTIEQILNDLINNISMLAVYYDKITHKNYKFPSNKEI